MNGHCYTRTVIARKPKIKYKYTAIKSKKEVRDKSTLESLNAIKIPATYSNVVICPNPKNRLLATAYDGTGRKQYFYSKKHLEEARKEKYCNLIFLGMKLPQIITDIDALTRKKEIDEKVLTALALKIMMICNFRVGSENNRKKYETYGFSTLLPEHVKFKSNGTAIFSFTGKKKQVNECLIRDKSTVAMLKRLSNHNRQSKEPKNKQYLFRYNGKRVQPESLNQFLGQYHADITTKTWRTWFANIRYIVLMRQVPIEDTITKRKRASNVVVKQVASELHHTPAICKKNYLMTELIDLYVNSPDKWKASKRLHPDKFFINFLKDHYSLSKDWIRKRSRSRRRTRSRERKSLGGAFGGPSFRPELMSKFRKEQQKKKQSAGGNTKKNVKPIDTGSSSFSDEDSSSEGSYDESYISVGGSSTSYDESRED